MTRRYENWKHVRVNGDRHAAAPYMGEARKLLGEVFEEASRNGLGVHALHRRLNDGTVIVAEKHGDIPRITITPVAPGGDERQEVHGDFVVWPRNDLFPDGPHEEFPQQILQYSDGEWKTYFYSGDVEGYDEFDGPKGVYLGMFADGVTLAGEVDWRGRSGERISWYGPSSRYWYDAWRQPAAQYGRHVFYLGRPLLDVDDYCLLLDEDWSERLVMGAGMAVEEGTRWLYVMLANIPAQTTPAHPGGIFASHNYPQGSITHTLRRLRMLRDDAQPTQAQWRVSLVPSELLWTEALPRACSPWVFSPDCDRVTTFYQSADPTIAYDGLQGTSLYDPVPPPATSQRCDVTRAEDAWSHVVTDTSLAPGVGYADVGLDYGEDGAEISIQIGRAPMEASTHAIYLRAGAMHVPLYWEQVQSSPFRATVARRIVGLDVRARAAMFDRYDRRWDATNDVEDRPYFIDRYSEVYVDGVTAAVHLFSEADTTAPVTDRMDRSANGLEVSATAPLGPMTWLWLKQYNIVGTTGGFVLAGGVTAANAASPFHPSDSFGRIGGTTVAADWAQAVASNSRADALGHRNASGFAAVPGVVVASAYDPRIKSAAYGGSRDISIGYATDGTLGELTGFDASNARWHPCWVLGKPIGGQQ